MNMLDIKREKNDVDRLKILRSLSLWLWLGSYDIAQLKLGFKGQCVERSDGDDNNNVGIYVDFSKA